MRRSVEQLRVLAALQTGNAELVQPAQAPTTPSSPKPVRNTAIGGVLGLLLGIGLALLFNRLDRRLRDPEEIKAIFDRPILGVVPQSRSLARSSVAAPRALSAGEAEPFRMMRANLRYFNVDRAIRSVLVTSAASSEGKTTVAWSLAAAAAQAGETVLLVEADLQRPNLASTASGLRAAPGLSTVLSGQTELSQAIQSAALDSSSADLPPELGRWTSWSADRCRPIPPT